MIEINFDVQRFTQYGPSGDDTITSNSTSYNYVYAYAGNDFIRSSYSDYAYLDGGAGNDRISVQSNSSWGWKTTIRGGTGDDTIYGNSLTSGSSYGDVYVYSQGDGNDLIYGYTSYDTVSITGSSYYTRSTVGSSVVISMVSGGAMTPSGASGNTINIVGGTPTVIGGRYINITLDSSSYSGTDYNDTIYAGDGDYVTVYAGAGNDTVSGYYYSSKIFGGAGADYFSIRGSYYSDTVDGGDGNDTIYAYYSASVNGGAGDDRITLNGYSGYIGTVRGGTGNDTIYGNTAYSHLYQYYYGDGSDIIYNVSNSDTISIGGASSFSTVTSGSNVIVSVPGSGNITLVGASGKSFKVYPTVGPKNIDNYVSNTVLSGTTYSDSITNHADRVTIYGGDGNDTLAGSRYGYVSGGSGNDYIYYYGNGDGSYGTVNGGTGNDTIYSWGYTSRPLLYQYYAGDGYDYIGGYGSSDTISIGGGTYSTMTTGSNIVVSVYSGTSSVASGAMTLSSASDKTLNIIGTLRGGGRYINITSDSSSYSGTDYNDTIYADDGDYVTVYAGAGNDTVSGYYYSSKIFGGAGNDNITVRGSYYSNTVDGGDGADTIYAYGGSINGGAGDDRISLMATNSTGRTVKGGYGNDVIYGDSVTTNGGVVYQYASGDGYDTIYGFKSNDTLSISGSYSTTKSGNDLIYNVGSGSVVLKNYVPVPVGVTLNNTTSYVSVNGSSSNDSIKNSGSRVTISTGDSADTISNTGVSMTAYAGAGNDSIYNSAESVKIYAGDGDDKVHNYFGHRAYIDLGAGNDSVYLYENFATLYGGEGNDSIEVAGYATSVDGGAGNDQITVSNDYWGKTIKGGTGNDLIYGNSLGSYGVIYQYANGDGNDTIYGFKSNDTLSISGSYSTTKSGNDLIYYVGSGSVRLVNYTPTVPSVFTEGNYYYANSKSSTVLNALGGNDTIYNSATNVTIIGGAGDDSLYHYSTSYSSSYVTMNGGDGNDTIRGRMGDSSISGGAGNDVIDLSSGDVDRATVNGGTGNDTIYSDNYDGRNLFQYASGDGADVIYYLNSADTLHVTSGSVSNTSVSGSDVILYVGSGSITLKNKKDSYFYLKTGSGSAVQTVIGGYISNSSSNTVITGTGYDDTVYNSGKYVTINTAAGNDSIYHYATSYSGSYVTVNAGDGNDTIRGRYGDSSIFGGAGNDVIDLSSGDVDRATVNGGTGNDLIYNDGYDGRNVFVYQTGDGNDTIYNFTDRDTLSISGSYTTTRSGNDLVYNVGSGSVILKNYAPTGVTISNSNSNTVIGGTAYDDSIKNSGGNVTINAGDGNDTIWNYYSNGGGNYVAINAGAGNDTIYNDWGYYLTIDAGAGNDTITVYRGYADTINAGAGDDKISLGSSYGANTVRGGAGNDTIYGDTVNSYGVVYVYQSGDGNDVIYNFHSNDTLTGATFTSVKSGSNVIASMSGGGTVTLVGATIPTFTEGADSYTNTTSNTVLSALGGNDTVKNSASKVTINAGDGDDRISNTGTSLTAYGGAGNDSIYNNGDYSYLDLGDGADSLYASDNDYVTVNAGAGADVINGYFYYSKIYGGYGDDRISVLSGTNTIDGGDGDDTISAYGGSISGGAGADRISLNGNYSGVKVNGGTGNDSIYGVNNSNYGVFYQYAYGDGSDVIYNYNSVDTISIAGSSQYTTLISGSNKIVSVIGSGAMTLNGAGSTALNIIGGTYVPSGDEPVYITNSTSNRTLVGTAKNDTIENIYSGGGDTVSINAGAGNDTIFNNYGYYITIDAGAGDDTITSYRGSSNSIDGGAGNDRISLSSSNGLTVVKGGTGNDTIYGDAAAQIYQYTNGDGYDSIVGYSANDTITITGGDWSKSTVGSDVIITVRNTGSTVQTGAITLSGAKGKTINIYPTAPEPEPEPTDTGTGTATVPAVTQQEVIKKFMGVLDTVTSYNGVSILNEAVSVASGGYFNGINAAINQMVWDCQNASSANDFLLNYCGINLSNTDTGAITGSDAGCSTTKTATSVVPESGSLNNFTGDSFTVNNLTIHLASFPYYNSTYHTNLSYSSLTSSTQRYIWQAFKTWWAGNSLDLIAESYGDNYGFGSSSSATTTNLYFGFVRNEPGTLAWTGYPDGLAMAVNMDYYSSITVGDTDGKMPGSSQYLDRVLAHELTHAVMMANISYFWSLPQFITEGMAELTHGIDDNRTSVILSLANSPSALKNSLGILPGTGSGPSYAGGYMFLRYLAKQSSDHSSAASSVSGGGSMSALISGSNNSGGGSVTTQRGVSIKSAVLTAANTFDEDIIDLTTYPSTVTKVNATALTDGVMIIGNTKANSISAGKGADTVSGNLGNDTIAGGAGNDILMGDAGNDIIKGDAGNDTISGGYGNDTLTGGAGSDVFIHIAGNDVIADYAAGQDKIKLVEENILSSSLSGSNVVLTTTNGCDVKSLE